MKIALFRTPRIASCVSPSRRRQQGTAMIVVLALLAIILIYVADNLQTLHHLGRELKLLEQRQIRRLQAAPETTNSPPQISDVGFRTSDSHLSWTASPPSANR